MTRQLLFVLLAATALTPACVIRRERLDREPEVGFDAFVIRDDTRADVGMVVPEDAGRDAVIATDVPGTDATTCGGRREACCDGTTCETSLACIEGTCVPCGGDGEACCAGSQCPSGVCDMSDNVCRPCGADGDRCCVGNTCFGSSLGCNGVGMCERCGGEGQACCGSGTACEPMLNCRDATCVPAAVGGCDVVGGACCPGALGDYCVGRGLGCSGGRCVSECGAREQDCCLVGWCRAGEGTCTEVGFLSYRCR